MSCTGPLCGGVAARSFTYDRSGNLATDTVGTATTTYASDPRNRLVQVQPPSGPPVTFASDAQGRRLRKTVGATSTHVLYQGANIHAEYDPTWTAPTRLYVHGPGVDHPLLTLTGTGTSATVQAYHQDGLGSVVALTNSDGSTAARARYDPWGNLLAATGTLPTYGFTGREPDPETGLLYYRARYYDPTIGRFTQRDPIGLRDGVNRYAYVGNSPTNYTDPTGMLQFGDHVAETSRVGRQFEMGAIDAVTLGFQAGAVDFRSGALSTDPRIAIGHGMLGQDPVTGRAISPLEGVALAGTRLAEFFRAGDLPAAAHMAADFATPGHALNVWTDRERGSLAYLDAHTQRELNVTDPERAVVRGNLGQIIGAFTGGCEGGPSCLIILAVPGKGLLVIDLESGTARLDPTTPPVGSQTLDTLMNPAPPGPTTAGGKTWNPAQKP